MATVTEKLHSFDAARAAGREPFKVKDLIQRVEYLLSSASAVSPSA